MPWIDSLDYLNLNSLRRYPLREGVSAASTDGNFKIPDNFISDFSLAASNDVTKRYYISRIYNKVFSALIEISEYAVGAPRIVGSFDLDFNLHELNTTYFLTPVNDFVGSSGKITIAYVEDLRTQPSGVHFFDFISSEFEPRTIIPGTPGVTRIKFTDSIGVSQSLTGDVLIQARTNSRFTFESLTNRVILDVGDNLGLNKECNVGPCIKRINGVTPDPTTGNLSLLGTECLSVSSPSSYTLMLDDNCCTPCSGCDELSELTQRLTGLETKFIEVKNFYTAANGQLLNYLNTINSNCSCD
jgi:hypothetical protein